MIDLGATVLLWFGAIGCGLMAGLYFAFSAFIMRSLAGIDAAAGIAAMNSINEKIVRSSFMPLFWGTTLASAALAAIAILGSHDAAPIAMLAGGLVYFFGMFVCTIAFNVPLNNELARVGAKDASSLATWQRYLRDWTRWNHVRTLACTASSALFVYTLTQNN